MDNNDIIIETIRVIELVEKGENFERISETLNIPMERLSAIIDIYQSALYDEKIDSHSLDEVVSDEDLYKPDFLDYGEFPEIIRVDRKRGFVYTKDGGEYTIEEFLEKKGIDIKDIYKNFDENTDSQPIKNMEDKKADYKKTIQVYIKDLTPEQQEMYKLSIGVVDGVPKTISEIARELGITENEAKDKLNETLEKFKE